MDFSTISLSSSRARSDSPNPPGEDIDNGLRFVKKVRQKVNGFLSKLGETSFDKSLIDDHICFKARAYTNIIKRRVHGHNRQLFSMCYLLLLKVACAA